MQHQYVARETGEVRTETLFADRIVNLLYSKARETVPVLLKALTGARMSSVLGYVNYDFSLGSKLAGNSRFIETLGIDLNECVDPLHTLNTPRAIFERKICYWRKREMPNDPAVVVSPADAKVLVGSLCDQQALFIKDKFFDFEELLGKDRRHWLDEFHRGDFAVFRLTPEKYHYNHSPVAGEVVDIYELEGGYHSCNPGAIVALATPYSKNKRVVTVIDTDVPNGTGVGLVAMVEVVALMIGEIVQAYSDERYANPRNVRVGQFLRKGAPKSLYRPGSSTDVLIFQRGRVRFDSDLVSNMYNQHATSRFSRGFGMQLVETDVRVRSSIARAVRRY
ncbi:MAG: phosphatidylserine decarboxylase [Acidiferrobacterales bacterium]|jgi:phosphatidylserine decarboxylase|nr:phosphatidylserine decarboxylase [Acidiferrobacterales bacterium]